MKNTRTLTLISSDCFILIFSLEIPIMVLVEFHGYSQSPSFTTDNYFTSEKELNCLGIRIFFSVTNVWCWWSSHNISETRKIHSSIGASWDPRLWLRAWCWFESTSDNVPATSFSWKIDVRTGAELYRSWFSVSRRTIAAEISQGRKEKLQLKNNFFFIL